MYYKKNLDFVALIWKDLAYQIDNKDSKKQDKMFYPRFTKIIIHHFLKKDKSILMRNKTFMHTTQDDSLLGTMRFIFTHEDTQVYGALLPKAMTNQAMLDSIAYKTYYAIASGAEPLNYSAQGGVPDEQQRQNSGTDEGIGAKPRVPNVPEYDIESDKESLGDSGEEEDDEDDTEDNDGNNDSDGNDDDDDNDGANDDDDNDGDDDDRQFNEEHEKEEEEKSRANQHNVSQESGFKQEEEDAHVTLTTVHDEQNTKADNEIALLMDTTVRYEEPSDQTSTLFIVPITDLFNTYYEVFTLKRSRDDKDKDQDPSVGSDRGTKRRKSSKEAKSPKD
nr:hypothetical protein [Tanacetum cinerariifolium]